MTLTSGTSDRQPSQPETAVERAERLRREAELIAQGHAEIEAGHGIEADELEAWLDALDHDPDAPQPRPTNCPRR